MHREVPVMKHHEEEKGIEGRLLFWFVLKIEESTFLSQREASVVMEIFEEP
jgi:hypothetical protein